MEILSIVKVLNDGVVQRSGGNVRLSHLLMSFLY